MFAIIRWLTKLALGVLLVSGLTLYLTWVTVHTYIDKLLVQFHLTTNTEKMHFSDFLANMTEGLNRINKAQGNEGSQTAKDAEAVPTLVNGGLYGGAAGEAGGGSAGAAEPGSGNGASGAAGTGSGSDGSAGTTEPVPGETVPDNAVPVFGQGSAVSAGSSNSGGGVSGSSGSAGSGAVSAGERKKLVLSAEDFARKKNSMTDDDKMKLFTLLVQSLPTEEMQRITAMVEDGITNDEMTQIQNIVEKYVKAEKYDQLMAIINKYE